MSLMSRNLVLAAATILTLGTVAMSSNDASARGFGGGGGFHGSGGFHGGGVSHGGGFRGVGFRGGVHHGGFRVGKIHRPHFHPRWRHRHVHWHPHWRPRVIVAAPVVGAVGYAAYSAAAPSYNRCTCLTKEYTQEGAVVFKDLCTKESAMNPPVDQTAYQQQPAQTTN